LLELNMQVAKNVYAQAPLKESIVGVAEPFKLSGGERGVQ
jgi:hypothetical protein